jgi:multisubunit Na+/H+ antiporter MnhC subunit
VLRVPRATARLVLTVVGAVAIGFGVPLLWVWIGSAIQGTTGSSSVNSSTAAVMLVGIVFTYMAVLFVAGWAQDRRGGGQDQAGGRPVRHPWNRSMRDEPYRPGERKLTPVEGVFVFTAIVVSGAFLAWFFLLAGSPLPSA